MGIVILALLILLPACATGNAEAYAIPFTVWQA